MKIFANEILLHVMKKPELIVSAASYQRVSGAEEIIEIYEQIRDHRVTKIMAYHFEPTDYASTVAALKNYFTIIEAAGGIVRKENAVLMMKRLGKWDLPKGKIDKGEGNKEAAVREVEEECGVKAFITQKIGKTWHTYMQNKTNILKKTTWYEMLCLDDAQMKPQKDENITKLKWVKIGEEDKYLQESYSSIQHIYGKFKAAIKEKENKALYS